MNYLKISRKVLFLALLTLAASLNFGHAATLISSGYAGPQAVAVDGVGNIFIADLNGAKVVRIPTGGGAGVNISSGYQPSGLSFDNAGNLYISNLDARQINKALATGSPPVISTSPSTSTLLTLPANLYPISTYFEANGNMIATGVFDNPERIIRYFAPTFSTFEYIGDSTLYSLPIGLIIDNSGNIYISNQNGGTVLKIHAVNGQVPATNPTVTTLVSGLVSPQNLALDSSNNLYVADAASPNGKIIKIFAVGGVIPANPTVVTLVSPLDTPAAIWMDATQNFYYNDAGTLYQVAPLAATQAVPTSSFLVNTAITPLTPVVASNGFPNLTFSLYDASNTATTTLPAGLSFNTSTGAITGTPTANSAATTYTVRISDRSTTTTATFSLAVITPTNGVCGSSAGQSFGLIPTTGLCSPGTASAVTSGNGQFSWSCNGVGGGSTASCNANWASAGTNATGAITAPAAASNNGWSINTASFSAAPAPLPANTSLPYGLSNFQLTGGTLGSTAQVTLNYTRPIPADAVYLKYGASPNNYNCSGAACTQAHWYTLPSNQVSISGDRLSITLTIQDGGVGDNDLSANSSITDPGGPAVIVTDGISSVPTLSAWGLILLSSIFGFGGLRFIHRRSIRT